MCIQGILFYIVDIPENVCMQIGVKRALRMEKRSVLPEDYMCFFLHFIRCTSLKIGRHFPSNWFRYYFGTKKLTCKKYLSKSVLRSRGLRKQTHNSTYKHYVTLKEGCWTIAMLRHYCFYNSMMVAGQSVPKRFRFHISWQTLLGKVISFLSYQRQKIIPIAYSNIDTYTN